MAARVQVQGPGEHVACAAPARPAAGVASRTRLSPLFESTAGNNSVWVDAGAQLEEAIGGYAEVLQKLHDAGDTRDQLLLSQLLNAPTEVSLDYRHHHVRGVCYLLSITEEHVAELQASFVPRPTDVFVTTYPKCGTTWTQQICVLLKQGAEDEDRAFDPAVKVDIGAHAPWLDMVYPQKSLEDFEAMYDPRIFKTHAPFELMPTQRGLDGLPAAGKVVYVARNPKDAAVSHFHHARAISGFKYDGPWGDFLQRFLAGQLEHGSWWAHHRRWWQAAQAAPERVHWLEYEQLCVQASATIAALAAFLGWQRPAAYIERVAQGSSIEVMRVQAGDQSKGRKAGEEPHIRKGGVGGWKQYFTVEQSEEFDRKWDAEMTAHGVLWQPTY